MEFEQKKSRKNYKGSFRIFFYYYYSGAKETEYIVMKMNESLAVAPCQHIFITQLLNFIIIAWKITNNHAKYLQIFPRNERNKQNKVYFVLLLNHILNHYL